MNEGRNWKEICNKDKIRIWEEANWRRKIKNQRNRRAERQNRISKKYKRNKTEKMEEGDQRVGKYTEEKERIKKMRDRISFRGRMKEIKKIRRDQETNEGERK